MFPVLVRIANPGHLLKPGMNAEVEIHVGRRDDVLAVPYAALRTQRDVASAATVLGLDAEKVEAELEASRQAAANGASSGDSAAAGMPAAPASASPSGGMMTLPNGQTVALPPGVTEAQVRTAMQKRMQGGDLSEAERGLLRQVFAGMGGGGGRGGSGGRGGFGTGRRNARVSSTYVVFVLREGKPAPVEIRTGLTDLDYIEVTGGLSEGDQVLLLPSASLVNSQEEMRQRMNRMTGGGGLPGVQQQQPGGQRSGQPR
jgi:HlyD family secretion protein